MPSRRQLALLAILLVTLTACVPGVVDPTATLDPNLVATAVAQTNEAMATIVEATVPPVETLALTDIPTQPPPTLAPCLPQHPGPISLALPVGVTASTHSSEVIKFFDFQGQSLNFRNVPGLSWADTGEVHIAGTQAQGISNIPLIYRTWTNQQQLYINTNNTNSTLVTTPDLIVLTGAPAQPVIAYSTSGTGPNGWVSSLYVANLSAFPNVNPALFRDGSDHLVIYPLSVQAVNGQPQGVWYTTTLHGIGNIIFAPDNGLYYYDIASNQTTEFVPADKVPAGLSPDHSMVAFGPGPVNKTGFTIRNLVTCQEVTIPIHANSNLGMGWAVFSPDNSKVAWIEAFGPDNMSAEIMLRVADTATGQIIAEAPMANLYGLAGGEELSWITPVGWVDNTQLLVELRLVDWNEALLVRVQADFYNPLRVADGGFTGFYYP